MTTPQEFDYIIAGAGSAGCALAARLSEDATVSVCLIEAGGTNDSVLVNMPAGFVPIMPKRGPMNWAFESTPNPHMNNRRSYQPRGRGLGGSSAINAQVYVRGHRADYDHWASLGNDGWGYDEVLPYFKAGENNENIRDDFHGQGGPLNVANLRSPGRINGAFLQACEEHGIPPNADYNGAEQDGCFEYQVTHINGERCSTKRAYLDPVRHRSNLIIRTQSIVHRVLIAKGRASGVRVESNGVQETLSARREVILCAGAYQSPQLLQLSGIGEGRHLQSMGIEVVRDLPGVGANLQDHLDVVHSVKSSFDSDTFGLSARFMLRAVRELLRWSRHRGGMLTSPYAEAGAFFRSRPDLPAPDLQLVLIRALVDDHGRKMHWGHGFSSHVTLVQPHSRGSVRLQSPDVHADPLIDMGLLSDERDLEPMLHGCRKQLHILQSEPLRTYRKEMLYPVDVNDDAALEAYIRNRADTQYHPVGSCKMGNDAMAVVDARLRVHGIDGLRVVDASVMPTITRGNTNAPTIMIGERAAAMICEEARKSPSRVAA